MQMRNAFVKGQSGFITSDLSGSQKKLASSKMQMRNVFLVCRCGKL